MVIRTVRPLTRLDVGLIVGIVLIALLARVIPGPRTIDDAFITFRYSRNIVEGQGFVYNPGSQVLGTTTPLYTLLMAAISAVLRGQDFQWYAIVVNALADAGTAVLLFLLARRLTRHTAVGALIGVLWAISPASVTFAIGGMETSLNIFWMVGATWLYINDQLIEVGIFSALGFLTRLDAVIWIGPLFAYQLAERWLALRNPPPNPRPLPRLYGGKGRKDGMVASLSLRGMIAAIPWRTWLAAIVTVMPWMVFSLLYFGSPFPHSVAAKAVAYLLPPGSALMTLLQTYAQPFYEFNTLGVVGAIISSVIYLALTIGGIINATRRLPRLLPLLIYPWLYLVIFAAANPLIFRWYVVPPLPGLLLSIIVGAWALIIKPLQRRQRAISVVIVGGLAMLWVGMSLNVWTLHPDHAPDRPAPVMAWHKIELLYEQVGTQLRTDYGVTPDTLVASADIGAIGYFSRARIIDTVGLVTPTLSQYYPILPALIVPGQNYAIPPRLILDTQPAYFVTMEAFVRLGLEQDAAFKQEYGNPIIQIPTDFYGTDMRVYKRQP